MYHITEYRYHQMYHNKCKHRLQQYTIKQAQQVCINIISTNTTASSSSSSFKIVIINCRRNKQQISSSYQYNNVVKYCTLYQ